MHSRHPGCLPTWATAKGSHCQPREAGCILHSNGRTVLRPQLIRQGRCRRAEQRSGGLPEERRQERRSWKAWECGSSSSSSCRLGFQALRKRRKRRLLPSPQSPKHVATGPDGLWRWVEDGIGMKRQDPQEEGPRRVQGTPGPQRGGSLGFRGPSTAPLGFGGKGGQEGARSQEGEG